MSGRFGVVARTRRIARSIGAFTVIDSLPAALTGEWLGQPVWMWVAFISFVLLLLWVDLGLLNRKSKVISPFRSFLMWAFFASLATAFGTWVWIDQGAEAGAQFFTGYVLETSLAFDNIFIISTIFAYFAAPREFQHRVLFWGIIGAIVFRGIFIGAGATIVEQFTWVLYIFAVFLMITGWKMVTAKADGPNIGRNPALMLARRIFPVYDKIESDRFFVKKPHGPKGRLKTFATPLFLALIVVEFVDIIFAIDSVPAIFAVTQDPFIVYTSNIFAILGLRSMYFILAAAVERFTYLKFGLSLVLILIGVKIFWNFGIKDLGLDKTMGFEKLDPMAALIGTISIIGLSILYSLWRTRSAAPAPAGEARLSEAA
jgi:tellurite resistance protein TerC